MAVATEGLKMRTQESESVIPFSPASKNVSPADTNNLDKAGQTILQLLNKAAGTVEQNSKRAIDLAQKFSHQLRTAEDRIAELEAEVATYQDRSERAEQ